MSKAEAGAGTAYVIIPEYTTGKNEEVRDEIDIIANAFENVKISEQNTAHPLITVPLVSESHPRRHFLLEIRVVPGYPYVPPHVRITLPPNTAPGRVQGLSEEEVAYIQKEVRENIQMCQPSGMPCMLQIVTVVAGIIESGIPTNSATVSKVCHSESSLLSRAGTSPSLTPVPLKAKDALRLSVLTLHLLRKCCHMKDAESKEEAASNFEWLAKYILNEVGVFPPAVHSSLPWKREYLTRAFDSDIQSVLSGRGERCELKKWLWVDDEQPLRIQQGTEGRYQNEFIQQRSIGVGGFAPVYVCRKKIDGRLYAIKKVVMSEKQVARVIREVQTLAALNHMHIVRYYDAWVENGCDEDLQQFIEDEEDGNDEPTDAVPGSEPMELAHPRRIASTDTLSNSDSTAMTYSSADESGETCDGSWDGDYTRSSSSTHGPKLPARQRDYQTLYIQMELCSARSLRHLIEQGDMVADGGLFQSEKGERVAASILRQLLSVMSHVHHERIVHRDLKPDNVLFEMENNDDSEVVGTIRVADFGLARVMDAAKRNVSTQAVDQLLAVARDASGRNPTGQLGSALYCAPEQEKGLNYDFRVDEFSIGMIALEMWLAIAGKGFRDRFTIMNDVWRTGKLPQWFKTWNPQMHDVIGSLLVQDPHQRKTCEEVLNTAELPGEPADFTEALETVDRYGERIVGRVIQRIQRLTSSLYRKPSPGMRDSARLFGSVPYTDVAQAVNAIGLLHGSAPVGFYDVMVPMNPRMTELGVESVLDGCGRCHAFSSYPHFAVASFLGMQENTHIGSFHQFYLKNRPYVVFTTPLKQTDVFSELLLEPLLCLLHLLSFLDLNEKLVITVSHAHWMNTIYSKDGTRTPSCSSPTAVRCELETAEKVAPSLSHIDQTLTDMGLSPSDERNDLVRRFTTAAVEALGYFGRVLASNVTFVLDPTLYPSESLVNPAALEYGIVFECRTSYGVPIALGCSLENFIKVCLVTNADAVGYTVSVDIKELVASGRHMKLQCKEGILLDGVAVKRQDLYSQAHLMDVIGATVHLWKGNIRACLRMDSDAHTFGKALKAKHIRWVLTDGKRLVAAASHSQSKTGIKHADIPLDTLRSAVRSLVAEEKASAAGNGVEVTFISGKEDSCTAAEARDMYQSMLSVPPSPIVVVPADMDSIEACFRAVELKGGTADGNLIPALSQWIKNNFTTCGVVPVFSTEEGKMSFVINYKRFQTARKRDGIRKRK